MTERPVLFNGAMVRAILAGTKTQTRRAVKPQPPGQPLGVGMYHPERVDRRGEYVPGPERFGAWGEEWDRPCPYGAPGDTLWVREGFYCDDFTYPNGDRAEHLRLMEYRADHNCRDWEAECPCANRNEGRHSAWRPSIHMPRWASRITLRVTGVRVERVQDISEEDARAEGVERAGGFMASAGYWTNYAAHGPSKYTARDSFESLWESINGAESWHANPWVWVVDFEVAS